jgi:hypothetical protein
MLSGVGESGLASLTGFSCSELKRCYRTPHVAFIWQGIPYAEIAKVTIEADILREIVQLRLEVLTVDA